MTLVENFSFMKISRTQKSHAGVNEALRMHMVKMFFLALKTFSLAAIFIWFNTLEFYRVDRTFSVLYAEGR